MQDPETANLPAKQVQSESCVDPTVDVLSGGQTVQDEIPLRSVDAYFPTGQLLHALPAVAAYFPALQIEHVVPGELLLPARQLKHIDTKDA